MLIEHLGLRYHLLNSEHLELLRTWRNAEHLSEFMHDRTHITSAAQKQWFQKISNDRFLYLLLEHEDALKGAFFFKDIDFDKGNCEIGFLIGDKELLNSTNAAVAQVCMMDLAFYLYGLKQVQGHVLKENKRAWSNYLQLGAKVAEEIDEHSILLVATKNEYEQKRPTLLKTITLLNNQINSHRVVLTISQDDSQNQLINLVEKLPGVQGRLKNSPVTIDLQRN